MSLQWVISYKSRSVGHVVEETARNAILNIKRKTEDATEKGLTKTRDTLLPLWPSIRNAVPKSPVPHLLSSNTPPSEDEIILIQNSLAIAEPIRDSLRAELGASGLWDKLAQSSASTHFSPTICKYERARQFVKDHIGLLSLMRRLPAEILQIIVSYLTHNGDISNKGYKQHSNTLPWVASQVCSRWRAIVLTSPHLWSNLGTIKLGKHRSHFTPHPRYLQVIIDRSRNAPLHFRIDGLAFTRASHPVLDILAAHSDRWKVAKFYLCFDTMRSRSLQNTRGKLASLQELELGSFVNRIDFDPIDWCEIAPSLRKFKNATYGLRVKLPMAPIIDYRARIHQTDVSSDLSRFSPTLETLILPVVGYGIPSPPFRTFKLPNLKELGFASPVDSALLTTLVTPSIKTITVQIGRNNQPSLIPQLTTMLSRSGFPHTLQVLTIYGDHTEPGQLPTLLNCTPGLLTLQIGLPAVSDIQSLTTTHAGRPLAPKLQRLDLVMPIIRLSSDVILALNNLSRSRCDLANGSNAAAFVLAGEIRRLDTFQLLFSRYPHGPRVLLESWISSNPTKLFALKSWNLQLVEVLPEINFSAFKGTESIDRARRMTITRILQDIDDCEVDVTSDIYHSGILHTLKNLCRIGTKHRSLTPSAQHAQRILEKWTPQLHRHLADCRWFLSGGHSLLYLSPDDALRRGIDQDGLVYGLSIDSTRSCGDYMHFPSIF